MQREIKSFVARDSSGNSHIIRVFVDDSSGQKILQTTTGASVTRTEKGHYKVTGSDMELTAPSDDPNAP